MQIRPQYRVQINYKSGNSIVAWFWMFRITKNREYKWVSVMPTHFIHINPIEIESICQIGIRYRPFIGDPKVFE